MITTHRILLTAILLVGMASAAYAESAIIEGTLVQEPKASDKFALRASADGDICVRVYDVGPSFDTSFGVKIKSKTGAQANALAAVGGCATACVENSRRATIFIFCDERLSSCDDVYRAEFSCEGDLVKLTQEGNE